MALICTIVAGILLLASTGQGKKPPCDHPLRIVVPHLFQHCNNPEPEATTPPPCSYSPYTEWEVVPESTRTCSKTRPCPECETGQTYQEKRTRTSDRISCTNLTETKTICFPGQEERLIMQLGLGSSGQNLDPITTDSGVQTSKHGTLTVSELVQPDHYQAIGYFFHGFNYQATTRATPRATTRYIQTCPVSNQNPICTHLTAKRSTPLKLHKRFSTSYSTEEREKNEESQDEPVPFNRNEHGPRLRRQAQTCAPNDTQHILFVLDSSGSIGSNSYQRMKNAIATLVPMFCKQIKIAMVTFSTHINLDFCFNCFKNTYKGRAEANSAISRARYHGSGTNTGTTTKCICENLLSPDCGIPSSPSCLDVVYITDGRSNGRHDVCDEVKCLHRQSGINTYAIGIKNYDQRELDCISNSSSMMSAFNYNSFDAFETSINRTIDILYSALTNKDDSDDYSCYRRDDAVSPTGAAT